MSFGCKTQIDREMACELSYGEMGEICMTGPTVMMGYYNKPEETALVLKKHEDGRTWLHSGDMGWIDEDGCIHLEGRLKRIIILHSGLKVSPFSIEKAALTVPHVTDCCVVGAPDRTHGFGQIPVVFYVAQNTNENLGERIETACIEQLVDTYLPHHFIKLDSLPLTDNGKVDFRSLEKTATDMNLA